MNDLHKGYGMSAYCTVKKCWLRAPPTQNKGMSPSFWTAELSSHLFDLYNVISITLKNLDLEFFLLNTYRKLIFQFSVTLIFIILNEPKKFYYQKKFNFDEIS